MKISSLLGIVISTIIAGISAAVPIPENPSNLLQKLIRSLEGKNGDNFQSNFDSETASILIPKLMQALSQDYNTVLSLSAGQPRKHVKRGAYRVNRPRWHRRRCVKDAYGRCVNISSCGFMAPVDIISQNERFGCRHLHNLARARRW